MTDSERQDISIIRKAITRYGWIEDADKVHMALDRVEANMNDLAERNVRDRRELLAAYIFLRAVLLACERTSSPAEDLMGICHQIDEWIYSMKSIGQ